MTYELLGISSISYGTSYDHLNPIIVTPEVAMVTPLKSEAEFGIIECNPEQMAALFATHMEHPTYEVNITTRRTPRKLKKRQKKFGGYVGRKRIHIKNASIIANFK